MNRTYGVCPLCGGGIFRLGAANCCPLCDMEDTAFPKVRKFRDNTPEGKRKRYKKGYNRFKRDFAEVKI